MHCHLEESVGGGGGIGVLFRFMSLSHRHVCGHGEAAVDSLTPIAASEDSVNLERVRRREIKKERQRNKN
jgi:hypothetical protein